MLAMSEELRVNKNLNFKGENHFSNNNTTTSQFLKNG